METTERERKHNIAVSVTSDEGLIISTQVVNEVCANLLKKAAFNEEQIKAVIQSLWEHVSFASRRTALIPQPLLPKLGEGEQSSKSLSQAWERDLG